MLAVLSDLKEIVIKEAGSQTTQKVIGSGVFAVGLLEVPELMVEALKILPGFLFGFSTGQKCPGLIGRQIHLPFIAFQVFSKITH